jgi:hypothetical protein
MSYAERLARKRVKLSGGRMLTRLSVKSNLRKSCLATGLKPSCMAEDADHHARHTWRVISSLLNKCLEGIGILIKLYVLHSIEVELNFNL